MKSDLTRLTFLPNEDFKKRLYSRVLLQQGRPLMDADFNEQAASILHVLRQTTADLMGPHAGATRDAFAIKVGVDSTAHTLKSVEIAPGRYYVAGQLCENFPKPVPPGVKETQPNPPDLFSDLVHQPYLPGKLDPELLKLPVLIYLDVWEHHRTWIDDAALLDPALTGADPSTRALLIWQVKLLSLGKYQPQEIDDKLGKKNDEVWFEELSNRGCLQVQLVKPSAEETCGPAVAPKYRGVENQLYRIEIHDSGPLTSGDLSKPHVTLKWSRENGSVVARWVQEKSATAASIAIQGPRDTKHGFKIGDWVELTDEGRELRGQPGVMVQLTNVEGRRLSFAPLANFHPDDFTPYPKVRRWDQTPNSTLCFEAGVIVPRNVPAKSESEWITLEHGLQIKLVSRDDKTAFRTGDFWLVPARTETRDIDWPGKEALPPFGPDHYYAPLHLVDAQGKETPLRKFFEPLTKLPEAAGQGAAAPTNAAPATQAAGQGAPAPTNPAPAT
jgi:hypothetical protein